MPVKSCDIHRKYKAGCDNCKEKSMLYQRQNYVPVPRSRSVSKNAAVKHCDAHTRYKAGCPDCQERARTYQSERKPKEFTYPKVDLWARMTEIGLRWEKEGLI